MRAGSNTTPGTDVSSPRRGNDRPGEDTGQGRSVFGGVGVAVALPPLNWRRFPGVAVQLPPQQASQIEKLIGPGTSAGKLQSRELGRSTGIVPVCHGQDGRATKDFAVLLGRRGETLTTPSAASDNTTENSRLEPAIHRVPPHGTKTREQPTKPRSVGSAGFAAGALQGLGRLRPPRVDGFAGLRPGLSVRVYRMR